MKYNLVPHTKITPSNYNNFLNNKSNKSHDIGLKTGLSVLGIGFVTAWWTKHKINNYFKPFNNEIKKQITKKPTEVNNSFINAFKDKIIKEISKDPIIPHYAKIGVLTAILAYVVTRIRKKSIKDGHGVQDTIIDSLSEIPENPFLKYPINSTRGGLESFKSKIN